MRRREIFYLILSVIIAFCPGCASENNTASTTVNLTVSVAGSLQDAMKSIEPVYLKEKPNTVIIYNFGSSGTLQQQIEQGAPVDVFISASPKQMNALQRKNLLQPGTCKNLLKNQVVLVTPKSSNKVTTFDDLRRGDVDKIAIGNPETVPAGQYSKEVLTKLNLYNSLSNKFVFAKDAPQVLFYVETGNVEAGIVYKTDAIISDRVKLVATASENYHSPIIYQVAVIKNSKNSQTAQQFANFLLTYSAQSVFQKYGFTIAN
jgi:molybdate transport system substrate-binding protein